jgi:hypothetical protein
MARDKKSELLHFLEREAFDPVLRARPDGRSEAEKKKLEHVQRATRAEVDRYRHYGSAQELVTNFRRDLSSAPAKKIHAELRSLDLPTIVDIRDAFDRRAEALGVGS